MTSGSRRGCTGVGFSGRRKPHLGKSKPHLGKSKLHLGKPKVVDNLIPFHSRPRTRWNRPRCYTEKVLSSTKKSFFRFVRPSRFLLFCHSTRFLAGDPICDISNQRRIFKRLVVKDAIWVVDDVSCPYPQVRIMPLIQGIYIYAAHKPPRFTTNHQDLPPTIHWINLTPIWNTCFCWESPSFFFKCQKNLKGVESIEHSKMVGYMQVWHHSSILILQWIAKPIYMHSQQGEVDGTTYTTLK